MVTELGDVSWYETPHHNWIYYVVHAYKLEPLYYAPLDQHFMAAL